MTLDAYLEAKHDTAANLAGKVGISAASISRIRKGGQNIPLGLAFRIARATDGRVTLEDLAVELAA